MVGGSVVVSERHRIRSLSLKCRLLLFALVSVELDRNLQDLMMNQKKYIGALDVRVVVLDRSRLEHLIELLNRILLERLIVFDLMGLVLVLDLLEHLFELLVEHLLELLVEHPFELLVEHLFMILDEHLFVIFVEHLFEHSVLNLFVILVGLDLISGSVGRFAGVNGIIGCCV